MEIVIQFPESIFVMSTVDEEIGHDILESPIMVDMHECVLDSIFRDIEKNPYLIRNAPIAYLMFTEEIGSYDSILRKNDWGISLKCDIF